MLRATAGLKDQVVQQIQRIDKVGGTLLGATGLAVEALLTSLGFLRQPCHGCEAVSQRHRTSGTVKLEGRLVQCCEPLLMSETTHCSRAMLG